MPKLFKMYGELFMEVEPQPWLIKASKTVKFKIADGQKFCVNMNTGALTVYNPDNVHEESVETKPKKEPRFRVTLKNGERFVLSSDFNIAKDQLGNIAAAYGLKHCLVLSDQNTPAVGYPTLMTESRFLDKVKVLYSRSHSLA
jgi:hypothetical protein